MAGKFELKVTPTRKFFFNLKAGSGQIILTSELYETKEGALKGIDIIKKNATNESSFARLTSVKGFPYFILKARNGMEMGRSEAYRSETAMENDIQAVKQNANAEIVSLAS
jgi:uncharacterized protein